MADPDDRLKKALSELLAQMLPDYRFLAFHRYTVTACDFDAQTFDGQPSISKDGLPAVSKVPIRSAVKVELKAGSSVIVGFAGGRPTDPFLAHFDQSLVLGKAKLRADDTIEIGETAQLPVARQGDMGLAGGLGTVAAFYAPPGTSTGIPLPMTTETPYFVAFGNLLSVPPTPPTPAPLQSPLTVFISSGSGFVKSS